jgi:uncharacterized membrane protein YdjX (TVP38/TMEM64 family)
VTALLVAAGVVVGGRGASSAVERSVASLPPVTDLMALRAWLLSFGPWAPVAFVALQAAQVVLAPIPGHALGLVSGYLFGALPGTVYSLVGAGVGTYLAVVLARRLGRPFVTRFVAPERITRYDDIARRRGLTALFVVFLIPGLPADTLCLVAGLTPLPTRKVVAVSVVARAPGYYLVNLAGAGAAAGAYTQTGVVLAVLLVVAAVAIVRRESLVAWLQA